MKLEVPVSDVDRSKAFYESLGFRMDIDYIASEDVRVVKLTPPGSEPSIITGPGITSAQRGSLQGLHLVVFDIEAAHAELVDRGIDVSDVFHDAVGVFHHIGNEGRVVGPDPDGSGRVLQEVKTRAPGR